MKLKEISAGYKEAAGLLSVRIDELAPFAKVDARMHCERETLKRIRQDMNRLAKLCECYYEKGYVRNAAYGFGPGGGCRRITVADRRNRGQSGSHVQAPEKSCRCDPGGPDHTTARDTADALVRMLVSKRNRSAAGS